MGSLVGLVIKSLPPIQLVRALSATAANRNYGGFRVEGLGV